MLTETEKRTLAGRAQTISERLGTPRTATAPSDVDSPEEFLHDWQDAVADGDQNLFEQRLAFEDLDQTQCTNDILPHDLPADATLPDWTTVIDGIAERAKESHGVELEHELPEDLPFVHLLSPFVDYAMDTLDRPRPGFISASAEADCTLFLADRLSRLLSHSMFIEFKTYLAEIDEALAFSDDPPLTEGATEHYEQFITEQLNDGFRTFFLEYSFCARLVASWIQQWQAMVEAFYDRLEADYSELAETFHADESLGTITAIDPLGDAHQRGRTVMKVEFDSGTSIAYKPRNLDAVVGYYDLLEWINEESALKDLTTLKILCKDEYGWVEWARPEDCSTKAEVATYYRRAGHHMAIFYATEAVDLHLENLIAVGSQPVFIDLETIFQPLVKPEYRTTDAAVDAGNDALVRTGMLPEHRPTSNVEHAAGFGGQEMEFDWKIRRFDDVNTDRMELESVGRAPEEGQRLPVLGGEPIQPVEHTDSILDGFEEMYQFLMTQKSELLDVHGPIEELADSEATIRALYRNTAQYTDVLTNLKSPDTQRTGLQFDLHAERLSRAFLTYHTDVDVWPVYRHERQILKHFNTPRFTAQIDTPHLYDTGEVVVEDFFQRSPIAQIQNRVRNLNEADLEEQLAYIEMAYSNPSKGNQDEQRVPAGTDTTEEPTQFTERSMDVASRIFDRLSEAAVLDDGIPNWVFRKNGPNGGLYLHSAKEQLYDGRVGIGVFVAALARSTGEEAYRTFAERVIEPLDEDIRASRFQNRPDTTGPDPRPVGIGTGLGSIVYGLTKIGEFLEDERYLEDAARVANLITPERIRADEHYDVLQGSAGAILALLSLYDRTGDPVLLDRAEVAGDHLLANSISKGTGQAWNTSTADTPLCGFSHGMAGISYALYRLSEVTDGDQYTKAGLDAVHYENELYDETRANWPDLRSHVEHDWKDAWCHGRSGIGLARLGMTDIDPRATLSQDVNRTIEGVNQSVVTQDDHLCCGNVGRASFLLEAGDRLDRPSVRRAGERLLSRCMQIADQENGFSTLWQTEHWYNPGLLSGETGIGYELLRANDDALPSLLLFE